MSGSNDKGPLAEFLTIPELAARLDKHPVTLDRWINQENGLPFAWLGRTRVSTLAWCREWLLGRKTQRNPTAKGRRGREQPGARSSP